MKRIILVLVLVVLALPLFAQEKNHYFDIGYELANYKYKEPGLMDLKSKSKQGVGLSYMYLGADNTAGNRMMYGVDFRYLQGDVDYTGGTWDGDPLTLDNLKDYYFEAALKAGRSYRLGEQMALIPYAGLGWRKLRNHLEEGGEGGYLRQSTYLYLPFGAHLTYEVPNQWRFRLTAEWDCLLKGQQISNFDEGQVTNDQNSGWGARISVKAEKTIGKMGVFVEPFFHYWEIEESDAVRVYIEGKGPAHLVEPKNKTREYGVRVGVSF